MAENFPEIKKSRQGAFTSWAKRNVYVEKLTSDDTIYIFDTESEANTKKNELTASDSTNRIYKVVES